MAWFVFTYCVFLDSGELGMCSVGSSHGQHPLDAGLNSVKPAEHFPRLSGLKIHMLALESVSPTKSVVVPVQ